MSAPRLNKQRIQLEKQGYAVNIESDSLWKIFIKGPQQSPFAGQQLEIAFKFQNFPFKGPVVSFVNPIYHPNVDEKGDICGAMLEVDEKTWAPTKKLTKVMEKIACMMHTPNMETPMNADAAKDYADKTWEKKARQMLLKNKK